MGLDGQIYETEEASIEYRVGIMEDLNNKINRKEEGKKSPEEALGLLQQGGAMITPEQYAHNAYVIQFDSKDGKSKTTLRILFQDGTGSDVVITNMTTLPYEQAGKGFGSKAVQEILQWSRYCRFNEVRATQVQGESEDFWIKNGFTKEQEPNPCNDFVYKLNDHL